ncbi:MAG: carbohydrate ABC transporter permease [Ruminococcaceae bacterium]|nr:carbohydrate ABC transporter permease [Oscillospiraceae bacterium]
MQKMRVRNHQVVLNRSVGGDAGIAFFLIIMGVFMFLPMYYVIIQSLKPLDELWMFPPRFYVQHPTGKNFSDLFILLSDSWVPFSRYIFNTVFITAMGTFGNLLFSSLAAYAIAKIPFPGRKGVFWIIQRSLMFTSTVTAIANFLTLSTLGLMDNLFAIIIPAWGSSMGLYLMKQFMDSSISDDVLESARLDGCSEFKTFWVIAMPMVKPAWLTLIIYSFQGLWNTGSSQYIFSEQLKTLNYAISQITAGGIARAGASAAATVIMMIVPILVFVISQSNIIETMASSGMKD